MSSYYQPTLMESLKYVVSLCFYCPPFFSSSVIKTQQNNLDFNNF